MDEANNVAARKAAQPRTVQAVAHVAEVLRCISKAPRPIGVNEVARRVGLDKSSVSRLIATLERQRFVERVDGTTGIRLGFGLIALVAPLVADLGISTIARPQLELLARESEETVNLSIWDGRESVSVVQALGTNAITHYAMPGQRNPAHCTASGKILLAFAPEHEIEAILSGPLERYTEKTVTDPAVLRQQLKRIRATGHAINYGEFASDVGAVAAVVRDVDDRALGSLTITVPMYRFGPRRKDEILAMVRVAAARLSGQLGNCGR
jgi:DNA-binding IclR family transcriptional regulator